tara:strand:- start:571 stop:1056 length:486 start_codon:yes stop_codon:yes gene_type:complete
MNEYTREELEAEYISTAKDNVELDKKLEACNDELRMYQFYVISSHRGGKTKKYKAKKKRRKTRRRRKPKKITIVGYPSCDYYIKARRAAKSFFGKSNVTDIKFSTKLKYKNWLKKKDGIKFSNKAKSHKTCPFVWTGNRKYIGGCDDTLVLIKKLKKKHYK